MIREVEVNGRAYEVDTNPAGEMTANIRRVHYSEASGIMAGVLQELTGRVPRNRFYGIVEMDEFREVVTHLGWRFSRSRIWQRTWSAFHIRQEER